MSEQGPPNVTKLFELGERNWLREDTSLYLSANNIEEFGKLADAWTITLQSSNGLRQIILDTWLLLDFWVRITLTGAFAIYRYNTEHLDLRYEMLPQSHERCLNLVQALYRAHSVLPDERPTSSLTGTGGFWLHLMRNHTALYDALMAADNAFLEAQHGPESVVVPWMLRNDSVSIFARRPKRLRAGWLEAVGKLDGSWYRDARRLNKARNQAAHSTSEIRILQAFGINGPNGIARASSECRTLVAKLLGITQRPLTA